MLAKVRFGHGWKVLGSQLYKFARCYTVHAMVGEVPQQAAAKEEAVDPLKHTDFFGVRSLVSIKDLFHAGVHLGHKTGTRNPSMKPYIFGNRLGTDIIDLDQTVPMFQDALNFAAHIAYNGGIILFINRSSRTIPIVEKTAELCGEYAHCQRWKGGTFTNATMQFGAVTRLPDLCIFINTLNNMFEQHVGVVETAKMNVPSIGIVDTNCNPKLISYPIPGNDDSVSAVRAYCSMFHAAINKGKLKRAEASKTVVSQESTQS